MDDDAELLAYLDTELGTPDGSEPREVRDETEEPESGARVESSFHADPFERDSEEEDEDDEGEYDEGEEDEEDFEDGEEGDDLPDDEDPRQDPGEAQLKAIAEAVARKQKEVLGDIKAQGVKQKIDAIRAASTDEEFAEFEKKMALSFLAHQRQQQAAKGDERQMVLTAIGIAQRLEAEQREDTAGRAMSITAAEQNFLPNMSVAERAALEVTPQAQFVATVQRLKEARSKQTEPARNALRARRQEKRADPAPLRENGGARSVRGDYDNWTDIDSFLDDALAS